MSKEQDRVRQLMALAISSPFAEEGRTAALAAVKLIDKHGLLEAPRGDARGLALAPTTSASVEHELAMLRLEVTRLRFVKHEAPPESGVALLVLDSAAKAREIERLQAEVVRLRALPPIAVHVVRSGESPRGIAEAYVQDPSRVVELVGANPQKPRLHTAWGWTFTSLRVGERLRLPSGWV